MTSSVPILKIVRPPTMVEGSFYWTF